MSSKRSKQSATFEFLPLVRNCINMLVKEDVSEKDLTQGLREFIQKMDEAQRYIANVPGLDMTEEEQNQRILDLKEEIRMKKHLIEQCEKCFETWK